ncbi:IS3 family transposase [Weissella cibaria]|uniref:IS3 family transposase n=1 Tax=Weissella cibaria TaxID=137591 RepID=UPI0015F4578E|nr:IS3 family transposase [Weissella cibaria]QMU89613.1 IS3 family transposase [Weissella cibaria]
MGHRITSVLSALNISHSTLKTAIKAVYNTNRGIYGYRRIAAFLRFILNTKVGDRLVWELMKNLDDLSGVLTTDITYIQLMNRDWVYLATVYDPEKRRVVSYGLSSEMTKAFATSVVVKALRANGKPKMIHSDMGSQYTSSLFEGTLQNAGIDHSYSRKGHPYDNARIESFHSLIKRELIYHEEYRTIDDVRASVEWYVNWYNNELIHALNGFKLPRPMFSLLNLSYRH